MDDIVEHFAPMIEQALAELVRPEVLGQVLATAFPGVEKAPQQRNPNQPPLTPAQQAALTAGTAGIGAAAGVLAGSGAVASAAVARALAMLASAPLRLFALIKILGLLYAAAYLAGAWDAAQASDGSLPTWMAALGLDPSDDTPWEIEEADQALAHAGGDLAAILTQRERWAKKIGQVQLARIENAIREAESLEEARRRIEEIVGDERRALLIAETEYARAQTMAARETYRKNGVPMVQWLHQPDACPACMENAAVSPIAVTARWPSGDVPVHPHCRCAEAPYFPS